MIGMRTRKKWRLVIRDSLAGALILCLSQAQLFAISTANKEMQELEKRERGTQAAPREVIVRPRPEYRGRDLKDPFRTPFEEKAPSPGGPAEKPEAPPVQEKPLPALKVQGIVWGGHFPQAIINDKVVKVGDAIEAVTISGIDKNGVEVIFEQTKYRLSSPASANYSQSPGSFAK